MSFVDYISWPTLILLVVVVCGAPFLPEPHLVEKLRMLAAGQLSNGLDIFDLVFHASPLVLLALKTLRHLRGGPTG